MGNNNTTARERSDSENHTVMTSTGTDSRLTNDQRNSSSVGPSIVSFSFRRTGKNDTSSIYPQSPCNQSCFGYIGYLLCGLILKLGCFSWSVLGLLGLSKTDLDERCQPSGLYKRCAFSP